MVASRILSLTPYFALNQCLPFEGRRRYLGLKECVYPETKKEVLLT
jgi:hypothetical protein